MDKPIFSGQIAYRGVIPIASLSAWPFPSYSVAWLAKHRHLLVFPISRNEQLNIVAFVTKSESEVADVKESWTSVCEHEDVKEDFAGFDKHAQVTHCSAASETSSDSNGRHVGSHQLDA